MAASNALLVGGLAIGLLALAALAASSDDGLPPLPVPRAPRATTTEQAANERLILTMFEANGYSSKVAKAAVINAWAESRLDARAVGDSGHAVGLFQISDLGGRRVIDFDRKNPVLNTKWIIVNEARALQRVEAARTVGEAAELFCRLVERPAHPDRDGPYRRKLAELKYGVEATAGFEYAVAG